MSNQVPEPREGETESQWRQRILRDYMRGPLLYAGLSFDPFGTAYHPAINGKPANVARWLRELADDIEGLEERDGRADR